MYRCGYAVLFKTLSKEVTNHSNKQVLYTLCLSKVVLFRNSDFRNLDKNRNKFTVGVNRGGKLGGFPLKILESHCMMRCWHSRMPVSPVAPAPNVELL